MTAFLYWLSAIALAAIFAESAIVWSQGRQDQEEQK